jgi:hypothetical protein
MVLNVINQLTSTTKHARFTYLRSANIEGFMRGTTLFDGIKVAQRI